MTNEINKTIEVGNRIQYVKNETLIIGEVVEVGEKGWLTINTTSGETKKVRSTQVELVEKDDEDEDNNRPSLARQISKYQKNYIYSTNSSGTRSKICGDDVSRKLEGLSLEGVWDLVKAEVPNVDWEDKEVRWAKLNPGQIRMCIGNMWRNQIRKEQELAAEAIDEEAK
jgi:hypothetical protein